MDRNLRTPRNLTEFEQETVPSIDLVSESSSSGGPGIKGNFSIDLKLGQVVDSSNELTDDLKVPIVSKMALSPSGSLKRARAINNGSQTASCLVDGCNADLSNCREYHRRHKVCELHSKTPVVTINGNKQRFCQQCSRFHSLEEFDEGKKSCRKRLEGHNRRRRKPQPEPLTRVGSLISNYQGTGLMPFSSAQVYPTTSLANPIWAGVVKAEEDARLYNQQSQLHLHDKLDFYAGSSSSSNAGGKQFSFLHNSPNLALSPQTTSEASICQPFLKTVASSENIGGSLKMVCGGLSTRVPHSDCALSLLSSSPAQTSGVSLNHVMDPNSVPTADPLIPGLQYNGVDAVDSILVPNATGAKIHCQAMLHPGYDASSDNEKPQTLPFYWEQ